ncbi:MAG: RDD family protein [Candidatus Dormibacteria bacterium]
MQPQPPLPPEPSDWLPWMRRRNLRVSDEDRERAVASLTEHHVQGRLTQDELLERTELAYQATTSGDLRRLLQDLPSAATLPALDRGRWLSRPGPFPGFVYVGFWPRLGAWCVDALVLSFGFSFVLPTLQVHLGSPVTTPLSLAYFLVLWATTGRTVGLWLIGARVVRQEDGGRLGLGRSLMRVIGYVVDVVSFGLGFLWAAVDRRKQGWHDKMASSLVVRKIG